MNLDGTAPELRGAMGVARLRLSRWLGRFSALSLATPAILATVQILTEVWSKSTWLPIWRTSLLAGVGCSLVLALFGAVVGAVRDASAGTLRVEDGDVVMKTDMTSRRVPRSSVASGVVVPRGAGARVELELAGGDRLFADVKDIADGQRALAALGLDAAKRRCTIPLATRAATTVTRVGYVTLAILISLAGLGMATKGQPMTGPIAATWLASTAAGIAFAMWASRVREITVGADGVLVHGRLRTQFLRFEDLRGVRAEGRTLVFARNDGTATTIKLSRGAASGTAGAIALRVEEAIRARDAASSEDASRSLLARAGRSLHEWQGELVKLATRTTGYREAGLSTDDLTAILANPKSSAEQRIGAALALAGTSPDEHVGKLRIAAGACANERMRVALTKLADGDVDERAVEEALAESSAEEDEAHRGRTAPPTTPES